MKEICLVCEKLESKYKCPKCKVPYCSIACFKAHKEAEHCLPAKPSSSPVASATNHDGGMFQNLMNDAKLSQLIKNSPDLQKWLKEISKSSNPKGLFLHLANNEEFINFRERLLELLSHK